MSDNGIDIIELESARITRGEYPTDDDLLYLYMCWVVTTCYGSWENMANFFEESVEMPEEDVRDKLRAYKRDRENRILFSRQRSA